MDCLVLTSLPIGSVGSSTVRITSIYPFPRRSPDHALGRVCKTLVRERSWHDTRRFDRQSMGTFGATPAPKEAPKRPSQRRSSPYHKRHALDRSHRITLARFAREVWSLEDCCQPLLPLAEGRGLGSSTKSSAEPKRGRGSV